MDLNRAATEILQADRRTLSHGPVIVPQSFVDAAFELANFIIETRPATSCKNDTDGDGDCGYCANDRNGCRQTQFKDKYPPGTPGGSISRWNPITDH